jgi:Tol biopolymer transport system component
MWSVGFTNGRIDGTPELIRRDIGQVSRLDLTDEGKVYVSFVGANAVGDIHLSAVDFGDAKQITALSLGVQSYLGSNRFPSWSADGKRLAYASVRGPVGSRHAVLGIRATDTGEVREVSPSPVLELVQSVTWSIDGALLVKGRDMKGVDGLYRVDPQTGRTTMLAAEVDGETIAPDGRISADGKKFLYGRMPWSIANTTPPQPTRIWYEKDLATGAEKEIARSFFGGVSPNGEYLGPLGNGPARPNTLTVRALNGSQVRELPGDLGGADVVAVRSATDSSAIYSLRRSGELWRFPMDGSQPRKVSVKLEGLTVTNFSIHPDGQQIAFETQPKQSSGPEIWVLENVLPR